MTRTRWHSALLAAAAIAALAAAAPPAVARPAGKRPAGTHPAARAAAVPAVKKKSARLAKLEKDLLARQSKGAIVAALKLAEQLYAAEKHELGERDPATQQTLQTVAGLRMSTGDYPGATTLYKQILASAEQAHGKDSPEATQAAQSLGGVYWAEQRFDDADAIYQRVLAAYKQQYGERSTMYATYLQVYGGLQSGRSAYSAAEQAYKQALAIQEAVSPKGKDDPALIGALFGLGWVYFSEGLATRATAAFDRALAISEKAYAGTEYGPMTQAGMILGVASIYQASGRDDLAKPLTKKGIDLYLGEIARIEKAKGPTDPSLSSLLGTLASLYQRSGDNDQAGALLERAIAIDAKNQTGGGVSAWLTTLSMVKRAQGNPREALKLIEQTQAQYKKLYGAHMALWLNSMSADILRELGDYKQAEKLMLELIKGQQKTYGKKHPFVGMYLSTLAVIYLAAGDTAKAEKTLADSLDIAEPNLALILATGTEADHAAYFAKIAYQLHLAITLHARFAPTSKVAARLALTTILRRKGRILDAAATSMAALRARMSTDDKQLLDDLGAARAKLSKLIVAGPEATGEDAYAKAVADLEDEVRRLEDAVRRKSTAYRVASQPIELGKVQQAIPKDARLIELVGYQAYDPKATGTAALGGQRRYAAYVLARTGDPSLVDLGDGAPIDAAAKKFLEAVADPDDDRVSDLGRALYDLTFGLIAPKLGGATKILLAPDGVLNLVPFSALVDGKGEFLIKHYDFTYLTSGRDLLRFAIHAKAKSGPVIIANPTFDAAGGSKPADATTRGRRSRDMSITAWQPLPGTAEEADAVDKLLAKATVFRGDAATEAALKAVHGPRILHIATHGFFLPDVPPAEAAPAADLGAGLAPTAGTTRMGGVGIPISADAGPESPLLRSGLALAGANQLHSGDEDGILTALEASGLDLWGTKLVVLSACETGVGKVTDGDGVHGLRRALVIAGAESLLMTLWQVDDAATRDLMTGFYQRLDQGEGRSQALRETQLELLGKPKYAHPFYWASFVPAGDNSPLKE